MVKKTLIALLMVGTGLGVFRCEKLPEAPERLDHSLYPPAPVILSISNGDRRLRLTWEKITAPEISAYYIYRSDSVSQTLRRLDSTHTAEYLDRSVQNGRSYQYRISARSQAGYEGPMSEALSAKAGFYTFTINSGATHTSSRTVTLSFVAPTGTLYTMISHDSTFANANWESYAAEKTWELIPGDGIKKVYARFRGGDDSLLDGVLSDQIILDTQAQIQEVVFNYQDQPMRAGDTLRIRVRTSEPMGTVSVDLGNHLSELALYDDGSHGDVSPGDGLYSLDWPIPQQFEIINGALTARFTDAVGNTAREISAETSLIIKNRPQAVYLLDPVPYATEFDRLFLSWTAYNGTGFINYKLYRHTAQQVDSSSTLVGIVSSASTTSLLDSALAANTTYYYRVYVTDALGFSSGSNIVVGKTSPDLPPTPVHCDVSYLQSQQSVLLNWTKSVDKDFGNYRIFRSEGSDVNLSSPLLSVISSRDQITYQDSKLADKTTYRYVVYTFDVSGQSSRSNVVTVTTSTLAPPKPVVLAAPASYISGALRLSWTSSTDAHFQSYRLFRSKTSRVDSTVTPTAVLNTASVTSYDDMGLEANTTYFYRIFVYDVFGHCSGSNTVTGKTLP
ncbi:hypothetical protein GX408_03995 [bacterium]|nr:hypothetical protein [bacterium]